MEFPSTPAPPVAEAPPPPPDDPSVGAPAPPLFPCDGEVDGVFPAPPVVPPVPRAPEPEPPEIPFPVAFPKPGPRPPPLEVMELKTEFDPEVELSALPDPAEPPAPTVTV